MVTLQIISKIIASGDNTIVDENLLTVDYFTGYEKEFQFIQDHIEKYGNVPDKATFVSTFPELELVDVSESDKYLVDAVREEYLFKQSVPVLQKAASILKSDSNAAAEYMLAQLPNLQPNYDIGGTDIIKHARDRYNTFIDRKEHQKDWFFESGFQELDEITHGIQRVEEYIVILARTNQGKSWILEKMCSHVWKTGFNVGYISPEMSSTSIGYRFDTLYNNYSNSGLMWGKDDVQNDEYEHYVDKLSTNENRFVVSTPLDFNKQITVSKLKQFIKKYKLDLLAIDGITYMSDERGSRGDNKTTSLTNISEDLMGLSVEIGVPVLVVVQANRSGVVGKDEEGTPELESIRDSDGIAHNASKVFAIQQKRDNVLEIGIKKQRNGKVGGKLTYNWDINSGDFQFIPSYDDAEPRQRTEKKVEKTKSQYNDKSDVF